jgi:DNA ligase (NAD+)
MNFKKMSLADKKQLYEKAMWSYHNEKRQIITDREFDKLEDLIREEEPTWDKLGKTGVRTFDRKLEVALTYFMPSLEKAYPEAVPKYLNRINPLYGFVMDKLDGTSLQLRYENRKPYSLTSRGDGTLGRDVTYFLDALVETGRIPAEIDKEGTVVLRLEGVMKKETFAKKWSVEALGEKDGQDNARQLCNGVFLRKDAGPEIGDIDLKVLGVYGLTLKEGLQWAEDQGFDVVYWDTPNLNDHPDVGSRTADFLAHCLKERRAQGFYEIDGLVVTDEQFVLRYDTADKPKGIWAFKVNADDSAHEVEVQDIEYAKTRTGKISIVARIPPTRMDGVMVERVTVHNAAWMIERGIGTGAVIKVLRSGGVIPKIVGVVSPGTFKAPPWPYKQEGRFFVVDVNAEDGKIGSSFVGRDKDIAIAQIRFFVTTLGIELLAEKTIEKLYDVGLESAADYALLLRADPAEVRAKLMSSGLGEGQTANIVAELSRVLNSPINLKTLMVASGCMDNGIGQRKLSSLEEAGISMDALITMSVEEIKERVMAINGWEAKTVIALTAGVHRFLQWFAQVEDAITTFGYLPFKAMKSGVLVGKKICFTGYRSQEQADIIEAQGGEIAASFSGSTDALLYKEDGKVSGKVAKAGDRAMTWDNFVQKFGISC